MSTTLHESLQLLRSGSASLARTMSAVDRLEREGVFQRQTTIGISANVSIELLQPLLRKHALLEGLRIEVRFGQHDDPVANAARFAEARVENMLLLSFFDNLLPGLESRIGALSADDLDAKEADVRNVLRLTFENARTLKRVLVAGFHRRASAIDTGSPDPVAAAIARFNAALHEEAAAFGNVRIIDSQAIVETIGLDAAIDNRFYLKNTAPYTAAFLDLLASRLMNASRAFGGRYHKVLALDCDNTLWGGIVGEDQIGGIQLDPHAHPGRVFWQVQHALVALERQGVLLCLCSKNNPQDVDEVLQRHPNTVLRPAHLAGLRVNWQDKVSNLRSLAAELDLGLDSFVFLDDSDFECEAVRQALPEVRVFQVPKALSEFPALVRQIGELFLAGGVSQESRSKTEQYRQRQVALSTRSSFETHEAYLASLDLRIRLRRNDESNVARISELTMKSNQFNLTTLRQTPEEIRARMADGQGVVYSVTVEDRFGSAGLTGVLLARWQRGVLSIDAFLMSCRVIGRGVEFALWPAVLDDAQAQGCTHIEAAYLPTAKNEQVARFYEQLGLEGVVLADGSRRYAAPLAALKPPSTSWIKVHTE